jgi:hypothetical protein
MLVSLANVINSSVMAEQKYPTIIPQTIRIPMEVLRADTKRIKPMDSIAPRKAAAIMPQEFKITPAFSA